MMALVSQLIEYLQVKREAGQGMVEYSLILVLVSLVAIAALQGLGTQITAVFTSASTTLSGTGS